MSGGVNQALDRLLNEATAPLAGPITGDEFASWSEGVRNVEDMLDDDQLRNSVAAARQRARNLRQNFKQEGQKPDWAVVRLQVITPLVEVAQSISEELARRASKEALVPLDRDPVPARYAERIALIRQAL